MQRKHKRTYKVEDLTHRFQQYKRNWKFIENFNKRKFARLICQTPETMMLTPFRTFLPEKPLAATFKLASNQFMDHSKLEFRSKLGFKSAHLHASAAITRENAKIGPSVLAPQQLVDVS
jgi:hypothetical protein